MSKFLAYYAIISKQKWFQLLAITSAAVVTSLFISQIQLGAIEDYFINFRVRYDHLKSKKSSTAIILIDQVTAKTMGRVPNFEDHKVCLLRLSKMNPLAIAYTPTLLRPSITLLDGSIQQRQEFAQQTKIIPHFYQLTEDLKYDKFDESDFLSPPFDNIKIISNSTTKYKFLLTTKVIPYKMILSYEGHPLGNLELASLANPEVKNLSKIKGVHEYLGTDQTLVDFRPISKLNIIKFEDLYLGKVDETLLEHKIILVGENLDEHPSDAVYTPYSFEPSTQISKVFWHSMAIETLAQNSAPYRLPPWIGTVLTILVFFLTYFAVFHMKPLEGLLTLIGISTAYVLASYILFLTTHALIEMARPLFAVFIYYYFFIPYRLIVESRRSWEYFQKNQLLSQVEELKTNFISMMSHDLKTPLARIRGMTDVITKDPQPISSTQREALDTIRQSTEDLNKFITTILNYAKIESEGVELHLQSRDINPLIEEITKKYEFMAKLKHIQIQHELEPMFSISMDPDLIRQVLGNLLENAIKYSPEGSRILITSEEVDDKIVVQVADQGMGIPADEIPNIFMKFFRSKDVKTSPIKGSGLGLYLAKYFVELHHGQIFVESSTGQGTTFTVQLPLQHKREQPL